MTANGWFQIVLYLVVLIALVKPLGAYMARVYQGQPCGLHRVLGPLERLIYRACGRRATEEMTWKTYAVAMLLFNLAGLLVVYLLQRTQSWLPLNPQGLGAVNPHLSANTAISFATNTNWQAYGGETTLSYLTQMLGLTVQNFVSAATGMAILIALIRGFVRHSMQTIGNFWVDLTRSTLYILLPLSIVLALILVSQGVVQTLKPYATATLVQPLAVDQQKLDANGDPLLDARGQPVTERVMQTEQTLALGPAASQIAIKQLGTNGGGFFNANSAHPFENSSGLSNFLEMLSILLISAALCYTFGVMVGDRRQGWAVLAAMIVLYIPFQVLCTWAESRPNPTLTALGVDPSAGNMEGKETRFGIANSTIWAVATTGASNGSVNSMHDSYTPLGGLVPMVMIQLGEVIFGGVGSGLYGMLMFAVIGVFVAGLMVGRTPEYLGKKIEAKEMKMATIVGIAPHFAVLPGAAIAVLTAAGKAGILNPGPHGFSEILYAFSSAGNNNGSAFAGLTCNTPFYDIALGISMLIARYWTALPVLAIAGSLVQKKKVPVSLGTMPTHTPLFVGLLVGVVIIIGALAFFPALALGPIVEHLMLYR